MRDVSFTETFEERLASEAKALGLVNIPVVVAVSGGPDSLSLSVSLSRLRTKLGLTMTLVYIDHRLRGPRASRAERHAVARVAHSVRIPLRIVDTGRELSNDDSSGEGIEARARRVRYRELFRVAEERGAKGVCLAHHLNDQAETVLMRLLSGSTVEGLAAMRPVTERGQHTLYRPMLRMERADILEYVRAMSIVPVGDRSNRDRRRLRSRIRTTLVPAVKGTRAGALQAIGRTADALSEADQALRWCFEHTVGRPNRVPLKRDAVRNMPEAGKAASGGVNISRERFFSLPPELRLRFLHEAVHTVSGSADYRIPRRFFAPLVGEEMAHGEGRCAVGYGVELVVDRDGVHVLPARVTRREKDAGVELIDEQGVVSRPRLPDPFAGLMLSVSEMLESQRAGRSGEERQAIANAPKRTVSDQHRTKAGGGAVSVQFRPPVYLRPAIPNDGKAFSETRSGFKRRIERNPSFWAILEDAGGPCMLLYAGVEFEVHYRVATEYPVVDELQASPLHLSLRANSNVRIVEMSEDSVGH